MYPVLFKFGPFTIYTYGVFVFLGVILGYFVCLRQAKKEGIDKDSFSDIAFWALISSFAGARIFYLFVEFKSFFRAPLSPLFSRSGFVFYGGIIFGFFSLYFLTAKHHINFLKFADIAAISIPLGHCLGRLGCFFYGCCYGKPSNSFLGVLFPPDSPAGLLGVKVIPTQLISSFFLFLIFFVLLLVKKRKRFNGQIILSYFFLYGIFRFIIEFFRGEPGGRIFFMSTSQIISLILVVLAIFLYLKNRTPDG